MAVGCHPAGQESDTSLEPRIPTLVMTTVLPHRTFQGSSNDQGMERLFSPSVAAVCITHRKLRQETGGLPRVTMSG